MRKMIFGGALMGLLLLLVIVIGESTSQNIADIIVAVVFGVAVAIPMSLLVALILRDHRPQGPRVERHVHQHDERQVIIFIQHPDGTLERMTEQQARQIAAPNGVMQVTR